MNEERLQPVMFGRGGDPMDTNSKMLILPDTKRYHAIGERSLSNRQEEILERA
jgi:hypothetical protein